MVAPIYHVGQAAGHVFNVWSVSPAPDAMVTVRRGGSDAESGESLAAAYAAAKTLKPGGNALAAANRAVVLIPPGRYSLPSRLVLDARYVDLIGMVPDAPEATVVTRDGSDGYATVAQQKDHIVLAGFTIENSNTAGFDTFPVLPRGANALLINVSAGGDSDNANSVYRDLRFLKGNSWSVSCIPGTAKASCPVITYGTPEKGTWIRCQSPHASAFAYYYDGDGYSPTMYDCIGLGVRSFCGDAGASLVSAIINGRFERCQGGDEAFGGCSGTGTSVGANGIFRHCQAGDKSYSLGGGKTFAGRAYNCVGGDNCFGGGQFGNFTGYARNCEAGDGSFGGWQGAGMSCSGILIDCRTIDRAKPLNVEGAYLRGCDIECTGAGESAVKVLATSQIYDSTMESPGGTDTITAAAAKNLVMHACRYSGTVHANVTVIGADNFSTGSVAIP